MKTNRVILFVLAACIGSSVFAQESSTSPDLSKVKNPDLWELCNRELTIMDNGSVHLDAKPGSGVLWLKDLNFIKGKIECDIKGQNLPGRSFVGIAFHGLNDSTYDAVYFRAFNFLNPERNGHSVQYISHPEFTWYRLREQHPEVYENSLNPVPEPEEWFHVSIVVDYPEVEVYVNNSDEPSLKVKQLSSQKKGWIGFWVGHGSEGCFRNLKIEKY